MTDLSLIAEQEIQEGRAVLLETALKRILEVVDEVVSYTIEEAPILKDTELSEARTNATIHFHCRLHDPVSMPLTRLCYLTGIVSIARVKDIVLLLRTHTSETITFKQ